MDMMKPPFDRCRSYGSADAFFEHFWNRVIRFYVYRRMFTPMENDKKFSDQSMFESTHAGIGMVREIITLPNDDVLVGIAIITEDVSDMDYLEYYRLSELRLSYWPKDDYEYGVLSKDPEAVE